MTQMRGMMKPHRTRDGLEATPLIEHQEEIMISFKL